MLTDNGVAFADLPKNRGRHPEIVAMFSGHIFDRVCKEHGIKHRLTKPYNPWTKGQPESNQARLAIQPQHLQKEAS